MTPIKIYIDEHVPRQLIHDLKMRNVDTRFPYCTFYPKSYDHITVIANIFSAFGYELICRVDGGYNARKKEEYDQAYD